MLLKEEEQIHLTKDPMTGFVQYILAALYFKGSLPNEPPDKTKDEPSVYRDKEFYFNALSLAREFKEKHLIPTGNLVFEKIHKQLSAELKNFHEELRKAHELHAVDNNSDNNIKNLILLRSNQKNDSINLLVNSVDANKWKCLHNLYHFQQYISSCFISVFKSNNNNDTFMKMNYIEIWKTITTKVYCDKDIKDWDDLSGFEFIDNMKELYQTLEYFKKEFV
jgi:hypothetical protein